MFNLQPGQGLGSKPSRLMAFGLGTRDFIEEVVANAFGPIKRVKPVVEFICKAVIKEFKVKWK